MIDQNLLQAGIRKFGGIEDTYKLLGGFSQNVYEIERDGEKIILKWLPAMECDPEYIKGELDWIQFLANKGLPVVRPILSQQEKLVETVGEGKLSYFVIAFEKAAGRFVDDQNIEEWNKDLFKKWGRIMGQIHQCSEEYNPPGPPLCKQWNEGSLFTEMPTVVGSVIMKKWEAHVEALHKLPKNQEAFGLIHNDLHQKNFHITGDGLVIFDFGDCEYSCVCLRYCDFPLSCIGKYSERKKATKS